MQIDAPEVWNIYSDGRYAMSSWSTASSNGIPLATIKSATRLLTRSLAILATGLISGFFYAYACSVTLGLAPLPGEQYVEAMRAINATVRNGMLAFGFFGTVSSLLLALAVHIPQLRLRRSMFSWRW